MGNRLRNQTVYGQALPSIKSLVVQPANFLNGGIIGIFDRKFQHVFSCTTPAQAQDIFWNQSNPLVYGWDVLNGFFQNVAGVEATAYICSHVGYTGSAVDGVSATASPVDGSAAPAIKLNSGYQTYKDYSVAGNRIGYTITNGARFSTTCMTTGTKDDLFVICTSIAGVQVGDYMKFVATGGGGATVYKIITGVDYSTGKVSFAAAFHATANMASTDVCTVMGFRLRTWYKSPAGMVSEVDTDLGQVWCSMAPSVSQYYFVNIFAASKYLVVENLLAASAPGLNYPADVSTVTYLASGADGTAPTTNLHWAADLQLFNNLPVRFLTNAETTVVATQTDGEAYCKGRSDQPKWIYNIASNQTKAQLITIGNGYQRANDVHGVIQEKWYQVSDPFSNSAFSNLRNVPCVGHVMGAWIQCIGTLGIHWIPATANTPIAGIQGVVGTQFTDSGDRTDLCEAGINTTIFVAGQGWVMQNFYTPSTDPVFCFANGLLMRSYMLVSLVAAEVITYNEPNSFVRIVNAADPIRQFYYLLWTKGSTGSVPEGETFGQGYNTDGTLTKFSQHVYVQADAINNPASSVQAGNRNLDSYFTFPSPAGSIKIGVGLMQFSIQ
jgi:hypothetical protein